MYQAILFDLDGTLTESGEGITKCVQYALEKFGIFEPDLKKLEVFVGPPLKDMMMSYGGLDEQHAYRGDARETSGRGIPSGCGFFKANVLCEPNFGIFWIGPVL